MWYSVLLQFREVDIDLIHVAVVPALGNIKFMPYILNICLPLFALPNLLKAALKDITQREALIFQIRRTRIQLPGGHDMRLKKGSRIAGTVALCYGLRILHHAL